MPAKTKIVSAYDSLPSAEKKVADFILKDPKRASLMVINDIAKAADVSVPSVTRLAKKLGYDGFMDFRVALAECSSESITMDIEPLRDDDADTVAVEKLFISSMRCIEETLKVLDAAKLSKFCDDIIASRRIVITGMSASGYLARMSAEYLALLGIDAFACTDPHLLRKHANHMKDGDLLVAISRTGVTKSVIDAIRISHAHKAKCAMISNNVSSPVSSLCEYFFCTARIGDIKTIMGRETNISQYVLIETVAQVVANKVRTTTAF